LSQKLERPVERIQRRTYREINDLLRRGEVDLAFVCTSSYLIGKDQFGLELLVAPQVDGQTTYRAKMLVRAASPYDQLEDLRGQVFAFTDPTSFTGRAYPVYLLQQMGETPQTFFSRTFFTYSHDVAIRAVVDGLADGASVDSLVLDFALKREPQLASQIRVIHTSEAFGMPPVVVSPNLRPPLKAELRDLLLNMHLDAQGQAALAALGYERFVLVSDDDYQSARDILAQVRLEEATP
jgi:phosphonate transport system substrate-binding protein